VTLIDPAATAFVYYLKESSPADRSRIIPSGDWMDRTAPDAGQRSIA
jgi:hypothetical protein